MIVHLVPSQFSYEPPATRLSRIGLSVAESAPPPPVRLKLLDQVREAIRVRHYSHRTEQAYVGWIKRFIFFHGKRHPAEMGEAEILSTLATKGGVSASTQNQALWSSPDFVHTQISWYSCQREVLHGGEGEAPSLQP